MEKTSITKEMYKSFDGRFFETEEECREWEYTKDHNEISGKLKINNLVEIFKPTFTVSFNAIEDVKKFIDFMVNDIVHSMTYHGISNLSEKDTEDLVRERLIIYSYDNESHDGRMVSNINKIFKNKGTYLFDCDFDLEKYDIRDNEFISINIMALSDFIDICENE